MYLEDGEKSIMRSSKIGILVFLACDTVQADTYVMWPHPHSNNFYTENGSSMCLQNVGIHLQDYTASHPRKHCCGSPEIYTQECCYSELKER
jgi:hypothetical protein